jgi:hypothetical protein
MHGRRLFTLTVLPILLSILSGCASTSGIQINDSEWCGSLGAQGAACFHTLTNESEILTLQQWATKWDDLGNPIVCTSVNTFSDWKADLEKFCSYYGCTYPQYQIMYSAFMRMEQFKVFSKKYRHQQ